MKFIGQSLKSATIERLERTLAVELARVSHIF
jgi:hypothetical protein